MSSVIESQSTDHLAMTEQHIRSAFIFIRHHACDSITLKDLLQAVSCVNRIDCSALPDQAE